MRSLISCSTITRLLLLLSIPASLLIDPICGGSPHHQNRRSPFGFQGVRGKRDINNIASVDYYSEGAAATASNSTAVNSLSPPPSPSSSSSELEPRNFIGGLPTLSLTKRAPVGFMGMRGKKDELMEATLPFPEPQHQQLDTAMDDDEEDGEESDGYVEELQQKSDLEGPRNKKLFFNLPYRFIPKRAPSGFMGMRGKKLFNDGSYKRGPVGFMGMRGKKSSYASPLVALLAQNYEIDDLAADAPAMGPYSDYQELYEGAEGYEKRGPANGFFGMRGKKWNNDNDFLEEYVKRAPASNFYGMRGKKQFGSSMNDLDNEKRAPSGFFGMRGKRSPAATGSNLHGYFSVMKRRVPFEFHDTDEQSQFEKRRPNGFFGMRGKKS